MRAVHSMISLPAMVLLCAAALGAPSAPPTPGGELRIIPKDQAAPVQTCPLKHTAVQADVAGYVARVKVKQVFQNPTKDKIEAVYTFPLPQDAAVDDMTMTIGTRKIVGQIKKREEARKIYEEAKSKGHVASLLDQERPNIFTQGVANVESGAEVVIEISYADTLKFDEGAFEFAFPMVVGPRYMPGSPMGKTGTGAAPDTTDVPDASKISPPVTPDGTRAGHDISLTVSIDAGMTIRDVRCISHEVDVKRPQTPVAMAWEGLPESHRATVTLKNQQTIPNKDFVLRYTTATDQITDAFLVHKDERGQFFTLILQPPNRVERNQAVPRELVFVLDTSGSMMGFPIEKAKEVMAKAIGALGEKDAFNLITFAGDTRILWNEPRQATPDNRKEAIAFLSTRQGVGGTEMMKAINAALAQPAGDRLALPTGDRPAERMRVVCFMTDGYVGNDMEIIDAVKKNAGTTRVFSFGIGQSVNRFLLDGMAHAGRGEAEYVLLESKADEAVKRFGQRIDAPVLTDIRIDWGDVKATDVYPTLIPDLWSAKPVMVKGRIAGEPVGTITLKGRTANGPFERKVELKAMKDASHESLASLWARAKVAELMMKNMAKLQQGSFPEDLTNEITALGLEFRLMTQFTSFVAVEEKRVTEGGVARTVAVPVEMPEGVSYEGVFGPDAADAEQMRVGAGGGNGAAFGAAGGPMPSAKPQSARALSAAASSTAPSRMSGARTDVDARLLEWAGIPSTQPAKLDPILVGLADKVASQGKDGNLTIGTIKVSNWRVEVKVVLARPRGKPFTDQLQALGFQDAPQATDAAEVAIGTIDVRKLEDLAKLAAVKSIAPRQK